MKLKIALFALSLLAGALAVPSPAQSAQEPPQDGKRLERSDVRALLEKGQASGSLPEGMVIIVAACMGEPIKQDSKNHVADELIEHWEFASNQVRRIVFNHDKGGEERVESRPFDSKGLCRDLLQGKAIEIQARKGKGPEVVLAGTLYGRGSRSIEVVWHGQTVLDLHETKGPALDRYRESDARDFGALYERLASQARAAFKTQADQTK